MSPSKPRKAPRGARSGGRQPIAAATAQRLSELRQAWVEGASPAELHDICRERFNLGDRQARQLLEYLNRQAREAWDADRGTLGATLLARFDATYQRAMQSNNLPVAVAALNGAARLAGLPDLPKIHADALREVAMGWLELLAGSDLPHETRVMLQLRAAARGLAPMPALESQPVEVLAKVASGELLSDGTGEMGQADGACTTGDWTQRPT
jgi:hypothetical protein